MEKPRITKARYWWAVLYPENMIADWEQQIADVLQLPFAYCVHDADYNIDGEERKTHLHLIVAFPNTTTYKHAMSVFAQLGEKALNTCKAIIQIRHAYDYLIHATESCAKAGKYLYPPEARIEGNNFDIGAYEQLGTEEKHAMLLELVEFIICEGFLTINDFTTAAAGAFDKRYWEIIVGYNGTLERYCRGNYHKRQLAAESMKDSAGGTG